MAGSSRKRPRIKEVMESIRIILDKCCLKNFM
jgi:hypothetical protein